MKKKTFLILLFTIAAIGILLTVAHIIYAILAQQNASVVYYVSKELW